jgi:hypothetical protein
MIRPPGAHTRGILHGFQIAALPDLGLERRRQYHRLWRCVNRSIGFILHCTCDPELCTYEGGYVDGKDVGPGFLKEVDAR